MMHVKIEADLDPYISGLETTVSQIIRSEIECVVRKAVKAEMSKTKADIEKSVRAVVSATNAKIKRIAAEDLMRMAMAKMNNGGSAEED